MKRIGLILAGGKGTRLWPASHNMRPKHLSNIVSDEIMLNITIKRLTGVINIEDIYIMTNVSQYELIKNNILLEFPVENIIAEPSMRNTAPCIILFSEMMKRKFNDVSIIAVPCDHFIKNTEEFAKCAKTAFDTAEEENSIVTIGIKPDRPETGYGYIYNENKKVVRFIEKPPLDDALMYIQNPGYFWNSGMFIFSCHTLLDEAKKYLPNTYEELTKVNAFCYEDIKNAYDKIPGISIDYGIMEKSDRISMVEGNFQWSDIGCWDSVYDILDKDQNFNIYKKNVISIDSKGNLVQSDKMNVALIGIEDLIIIDTDDSLLICKRNNSQKVGLLSGMIANEK